MTIAELHVEQVMDKLNNCSENVLVFKIPNEVFFEIKPNVTLTAWIHDLC